MKPTLFNATLALTLALTTAVAVKAGIPSVETKLTPGDPSLFRNFGSSVAIDGNTAVVGVPRDSFFGPDGRAVYVFVRNDSTWEQQAKLVASDPTDASEFGYSVGISGDTLVVGARLDSAGGVDAGAAYVFTRSGTTWTEQAKLVPSDVAAGKRFGAAVTIEGDTIVVGATGDTERGFDAGAVYVFTRTAAAWSQQTKLVSGDIFPQGNLFGFSVALNGGTLVIGSPFDDDTGVIDAGMVYVFTGAGATWSQQQELSASDPMEDAALGSSVALSGDTLVAGAPQDHTAVEFAGSAYVFTRTGATWSQQAKLVADDAASFDCFGFSVAVSGNTAAIGSVLDRTFADTAADPDAFTGSAYTFARTGDAWTQSSEFTAGDIANFDQFGYAIAMSGGTILVGVPFSGGLDDGAAYVYESSGNSDPVANAQSVTTAEDTAVAITLTGSDADGDTLSFTVLSSPTKGVLSGTAPNLLYTPNLNENGSDSFIFKVNDGTVDSAAATVSITITPVNDAPVANGQLLSGTEDTALSIILTGSDVEGDPLTYVIATSPAKGTLSGTPPNLTYTPFANKNGTDSFTFVANDGAVDSAPATVSIQLAPVNDAPTISEIPEQFVRRKSTSDPIDFIVSDVDNPAASLTVSGSSSDQKLVHDANIVFGGSGETRTVTITTEDKETGSTTITVVVSDGISTASTSFTVTVTRSNRPPRADATASVTTVISPNNVSASARLDGSRSSDPDGDALAYAWFADGNPETAVGHGVVDTPTLRVGNHTILLRVNDGLASDETSIQLRVITAAAATEILREHLYLAGLPKGKERALSEALKNAIRLFEKGRMAAGVKQLAHFQKTAQAFTGKRTDPTLAALIAEAEWIIEAMTGS